MYVHAYKEEGMSHLKSLYPGETVLLLLCHWGMKMKNRETWVKNHEIWVKSGGAQHRHGLLLEVGLICSYHSQFNKLRRTI